MRFILLKFHAKFYVLIHVFKVFVKHGPLIFACKFDDFLLNFKYLLQACRSHKRGRVTYISNRLRTFNPKSI